MDDNINHIYSTNGDKQNYLFFNKNYWLKSLVIAELNQPNQDLRKVRKEVIIKLWGPVYIQSNVPSLPKIVKMLESSSHSNKSKKVCITIRATRDRTMRVILFSNGK